MWELQTFTLDPPLRRIAPPLDSIRPGRSFGMSRLTWFLASWYPLVLPLAHPPLGGGVAGGPRSDTDTVEDGDVMTPLALAIQSSRRVAVVLGHSYLVIADVLPNKLATATAPASGKPPTPTTTIAAVSSSSTSSTTTPLGRAAAPPLSQRGRALDVLPLHFTYATVPARAPHAVDLRCLSRKEEGPPNPGSVAVHLGPGVASADASGRAYGQADASGGVPLELLGGTLVMDNVDLALHTRDHLDAARRRILDAKIAVLLGDIAPPAVHAAGARS